MSSEKICRSCGATFPANVVFCTSDGSVLESRDGDPLVGKVVAERYRIIARIGEGGMGQVYLAEHVHMRRKCAVKFLTPELADNEAAMKRFIREAENASRIDHPNVVTMYDFNRLEDGTVYLAMEFVDGESLRKRIDRDGVLSPELATSVVRQTASALAAAHALGIVHRDLKPDNIMLMVRGDEVRVKVVDFGIAKAKDPAQKVTVTGAIVGTPDYMSPEQVTNDPLDGRSDQYALALVAVKMLTGKLPFANTTGVESLTSRLFSEPTPLRTLRTDVSWPQQLQDVITKALSAKPDARYASVTEFAKAFDRAASRIAGALAATVGEIRTDIIPPTRLSEPAARAPRPAGVPEAEPARRRRITPWLAAAGIVGVVGASAAYMMGGKPDAAPLHLPVAQAPATVAADSQVRLQADTSAPSAVTAAGRADSAAAPPAERPVAATPTGKAAASVVTDAPPKAPAVSPKPATPTNPAGATKTDGALVTPPVAAPAVPRDTTTRAAPAPAGLTSEQVAAEVTRVRALMTPDSPPSNVSAAIAALDRMLPRLVSRSDSVRVLYLGAQAHALNEDIPAACRSLGTARRLAAGTAIEEPINRTSRNLGCSQ